MLAPLAKLIDWSAIQVLAAMQARGHGNPRLEEAIQFLNGPDFIPAESQPARVEFTDPIRFRFPTPRPCDIAENNVVYGRLYRCGKSWQERPVIVLLPGNHGLISRSLFASIARQCNQAEFNAATLVAPYQFRRRPHRREVPSSTDYLRMAEAAAQAVAEIRALAGWLLGEGCPAVALWGSSHGAWLAGLTACRDARLASVVLTTPGVRMNLSLPSLVFSRSIRAALQREQKAWEILNLTSLNLISARPVIPRENILLIEATHDLFVPKETIEELWQAWEQPEIWRLPSGHISVGLKGAPGMTARVLRWLRPRLQDISRLASAAKTGD